MAFGMYESPFYHCDNIPGNNLIEKRSAVIPVAGVSVHGH